VGADGGIEALTVQAVLSRNVLHSIGLQASGDARIFAEKHPGRNPKAEELDYFWNLSGKDIVRAYKLKGIPALDVRSRYQAIFLATLRETFHKR
jgi:hypothetical protein